MKIKTTDIPEVIRVILKDGHTFKVRPIGSDDREKLRTFFYRLSPHSRYLRFGYTKEHISEQELVNFTELNPPDTYAYVGLIGEGDAESIRAVGRWFLEPDKKSAEIAFAVEDDIQAQGIGTALLEKLAEAAGRYKIRKFVAHVLPENTRMLSLFEESGFLLTKRINEGRYEIIFDLEKQEEFSKRQERREHTARSAGMRRVVYPKSVVVVGASRDPESIGGKVFRNLLYSNFSGTIFPVNPNAASINGVLCYPTIAEVPGNVDLVVIVVPAKMVLDVVDQCGKRGVWGVLVISAGFSEAGDEGKERQRLLREKVLSYGMRCIGPNCLGIINTDPQVNLNATFAPAYPPRGTMSIGTHSGALGLALLDYAKNNNLGIAHFASIGNRVDISSNDLLEFWEDDENTKVILLYLEAFGNTRRFSRISRRISGKKPIIAVKSGRSEAGSRAASSHTGALAASDVAADVLFRKAGVIRVDTIEEMFNVAKGLAGQPLPLGPNVAILTNAGGPGVLTADAAIGWGLEVPPLSAQTQQRLSSFLPKEAAVANPVDMIASAPGVHFKKALKVLLDAEEIDSIIVVNIPLRAPEEVAAGIRGALEDYRGDKPVLACFMMSDTTAVRLTLDNGRNIPLYVFPEDAVKALSRAWPYAQYRKLDHGRLVLFADINEDRARRYLISQNAAMNHGGWLPQEVATGLMKEYGIPVVETRYAESSSEAAEAANDIGFPVVIKLRSSTITHKTDVGGIVLNIQDKAEAEQAFTTIRTRLDKAGHIADFEGVVVQPMLKGGQEVVVGMSNDPVFGPLVMVGMGGVYVELNKDVAFALHPLTDRDPDVMLSQLKSLPLLTGWRGSAPKDMDTLREILLRFSAMIEDFPEISEMEINPLMVFDNQDGCAVVDARILFTSQDFV